MARKVALEVRPEGKRASRHEALLELITNYQDSVNGALRRLVDKALEYFGEGRDPDECYRDFDLGRLGSLLALDRKGAAKALREFKGCAMEEKVSAGMFVSIAIVAIHPADPLMSRMIIAEILRASKGDPEMREMADVVLLAVAQAAADSGGGERPLSSLGVSCLKRLARDLT